MVDTFVNDDATIGTTSSKVLPDRSSLNQQRLSFILTNSGTVTIWLAIDAEAVVGKGIPLYAGGSIERVVNTRLPPQKQITAISSGAGSTLSIFEEVFQ